MATSQDQQESPPRQLLAQVPTIARRRTTADLPTNTYATKDGQPVTDLTVNPPGAPLFRPPSPSGPPSPNGNGPSAPAVPSTGPAASPPPTPTSTDPIPASRRVDWRPGGDPVQVAKVFGGLFVLTVSVLGLLARQRGKTVRMPTPRQRDDFALPVARIAVRHLPLDALGPDLADATEAVTALHTYAMDGPLIVPLAPEPLDTDLEEMTP